MKAVNALNPDQVLIQCTSLKRLERYEKIAKLLAAQRTDIQLKLKKQFQNYVSKCTQALISVEKTHSCSYLLEQSYEALASYLRACFNLMSVFFPIISTEQFISLQQENQLLNRAQQLKKSIFRSFKSLCCRLSVAGEPKIKNNSNRSIQEMKGKKSSNTKTPLENSIVLTQWLLRKFKNPYPSTKQKEQLARQSNLTVPQVNNWFINSRERVVKKYFKKEAKDCEGRDKKNLDKQSSSK